MDNLRAQNTALGKGTSYYSIYHYHNKVKHMSHLESTKLETLGDLSCPKWRTKSRRLGDGRWRMVEGNWQGKMGEGGCGHEVKYVEE